LVSGKRKKKKKVPKIVFLSVGRNLYITFKNLTIGFQTARPSSWGFLLDNPKHNKYHGLNRINSNSDTTNTIELLFFVV
jgi:hypothetical protein